MYFLICVHAYHGAYIIDQIEVSTVHTAHDLRWAQNVVHLQHEAEAAVLNIQIEI